MQHAVFLAKPPNTNIGRQEALPCQAPKSANSHLSTYQLDLWPPFTCGRIPSPAMYDHGKGPSIMAARQPEALSEREIEILQSVATGATNQQIARDLVISPNTVKVHLRNIFAKLDVESRTEAALYAVRQGWVEMEGMTVRGETAEVAPTDESTLAPLPLSKRVVLAVATLTLLLLVFLPQMRRSLDATLQLMADQLPEVRVPGPRQVAKSWTTRAQMPTPRARFAQVEYDGLIFVIAGAAASGVTGELEVYDPATDSWQRMASKPAPVSNVGAVVLNGNIYVPGGCDATGSVTTTVEVYSPLADSWKAGVPLPSPLCAYAIAEYKGDMYLFGGWDGEDFVDVTYRYEPASREWSLLSPLSSPRAFAASAVIDDIIYVVGGYDGEKEYTTCQAFQPEKEGTNQSPWTTYSSMSQGRAGLALVSVGSSLYAIGGGWQGELTFNERYDVENDRWSSFGTPFITQWRTLGASVVEKPEGTMIYAVGGWSGDYLSANERYQAIFRVHIPSVRE